MKHKKYKFEDLMIYSIKRSKAIKSNVILRHSILFQTKFYIVPKYYKNISSICHI